MPISDDVPYLSRFLTKFIEIVAAGFATAVSGYLIAHLSGVLSSPAPAQAPAPAATIIGVGSSANSSALPQPIPPNSGPVNEPSVASPQQANAPVVAEHTPPQQQLNAPPVAQFTPGGVNDVRATASRKHIETTTSAAESKRDQRSFIARVQAALRNAGQPKLDRPRPHPGDTDILAPHSAPVPDLPAALAATPAGATGARSGPGLEAPVQPNTPSPIEIESRPITTIESAVPLPEKETGVLSGLNAILRHDPYAGSDDAPRPPMPVGQ
jgi:hypothetical protein